MGNQIAAPQSAVHMQDPAHTSAYPEAEKHHACLLCHASTLFASGSLDAGASSLAQQWRCLAVASWGRHRPQVLLASGLHQGSSRTPRRLPAESRISLKRGSEAAANPWLNHDKGRGTSVMQVPLSAKALKLRHAVIVGQLTELRTSRAAKQRHAKRGSDSARQCLRPPA